MREIKFRAWDRVKGRWLSMDEFSYHILYADWGCDDKGIQTVHLGGTREDEDIEWLQYTGLKDKNGREIYEGDIVRRFDTDKGNPIKWRSELACFDFSESSSYILHPAMTQWYEVIGNIYENKDML